MKRLLILLLLVRSEFASSQDDGEKRITREIAVAKRRSLDLKFDLGAGFGEYQNELSSPKSFGGLLLGISWISDAVFASGSPFIQAHTLLDFSNKQAVRKGFGIGQYFYVLGGKKQTVERAEIAQIVSASTMSLMIPVRISQHFFSATPSSAGAVKLDGTTLNLSSGLAYTWNLSNGSSLGAEVFFTLLSLANSVEKVTEASTDLQIHYRLYL